MTLPAIVRDEVEARVGRVLDARPIGGGCIQPSFRVRIPDAEVFLKYDLEAAAGFFGVEAEGLRALAAAGSGLRVPAVLDVRDAAVDGEPGWLALEWLEPARPGPGDGARLGRGLAALHAAGAPGWGGERDGFIGSLPQENRPATDWPSFWRERRIEPQLRLATDGGLRPGADAEWARLLDALPGLLAAGEEDGPSLLHGDLWSGNVLFTASGPALVDPAAYGGHREVDLAMADLFGGFPRDFHPGYRERLPLRPGHESRRPVYQLYYLLVHVNLFGAGYVERTAATLRRALAA